MKLQKMIVTNKDLSEFNSLQIAVNAKYYLECKTDSEIEQAFQFIKKNKIKFLILGEGTNVVFTKPYDGLIICLLYTSPSPRDPSISRMPSSA